MIRAFSRRTPERRRARDRARSLRAQGTGGSFSPTGEGPLKAVAPARRPSNTTARMPTKPVTLVPLSEFFFDRPALDVVKG